MASPEEKGHEELLRSAALQTANSILVAQRRAEQELRQAKQALEQKTQELAHSVAATRATLESTTDGILVTDEHGKVTDHNEKYAEMWRIPRELLRDGDALLLREIASLQVKDPTLFLARLAEVQAESPPESFDLLELADGRTFERYSKWQRLDGRNVGRVWSFRDITARRRSEQELRTSEERFRQLWATTTDAIVIADGVFRVYYANPAVESTLGYTPADLLRDGMMVFIPERLREAHTRGVRRYLESGVRKLDWRGTETWAQHRDGREIPIEISFSHFRENGRDLFASFIQDITERKRSQEILEAAKTAAEEASKAKDDFLAVLSHELRTPLTPALVAANYLVEHEGLPTELRQVAETIRRNVLLEAQLIDDLLDLTRISRGKVELHCEAVNVHEALADVVAICRENIDAKHLEILTGFDAGQHWVWADPTRLRQVFWNLLNNAVKFTPTQGLIGIRSSNSTNDELIVEVSDTGVGIEPSQIERVFTAFEQGERTVTRKFGGLGLGLAITKNLVDLHRGRITAESGGTGQGTRFRVTLASMAQSEAFAATPREVGRVSSTARMKRILLTDDHEDTRRILSMMLRRQGHDVVCAGTVGEALALFEASYFDLIISDIGLPDATGHDLMAAARTRRREIPGIALSGFGLEEDLRRSAAAGFSHHLIKPVDFKILNTLVDQVE